MTYDTRRVTCPMCGRLHHDGNAGQWVECYSHYFCPKCLRTGTTEGFNLDHTARLQAHLRACGLPPAQTNENGFAIIPIETARIIDGPATR